MYTKNYIDNNKQITEYYSSWYEIFFGNLFLGITYILIGLCMVIFLPYTIIKSFFEPDIIGYESQIINNKNQEQV